MNELDYNAIGQRIRQARKQQHITQEKLGELCALSAAHIGHIERGTRIPSLQTAAHIASVLNVSMDYLLFDAACTPDGVFTALTAILRGKNEAQVKTFLSAVKALAGQIDSL